MHASILVLEPEISSSLQVRHALEGHGHRALVVPNAAIALGALRHVQFDIFVAPLSPLTISAQNLSTQAKLLQPQLRVLVLDELGHRNDLSCPSIDAYIRKPICNSTLGDTVRALLSRADGTGLHSSVCLPHTTMKTLSGE